MSNLEQRFNSRSFFSRKVSKARGIYDGALASVITKFKLYLERGSADHRAPLHVHLSDPQRRPSSVVALLWILGLMAMFLPLYRASSD